VLLLWLDTSRPICWALPLCDVGAVIVEVWLTGLLDLRMTARPDADICDMQAILVTPSSIGLAAPHLVHDPAVRAVGWVSRGCPDILVVLLASTTLISRSTIPAAITTSITASIATLQQWTDKNLAEPVTSFQGAPETMLGCTGQAVSRSSSMRQPQGLDPP
jgi:hypothetical protein